MKNARLAVRDLAGFIFDVDGVLWIDGRPAPYAVELLNDLSERGVPFCLLTNDCSCSCNVRTQNLTDAGFSVDLSQVLTAPIVTAEWLEDHEISTIYYVGNPGAAVDLQRSASMVEEGGVGAVVIGDLFDHYRRRVIQRAVDHVLQGAALVAMQRNRFCYNGLNLQVDNGFWVAAIEFVTGVSAVVTGKPSVNAYSAALNRINISSQSKAAVAMISDDIEFDLKGAYQFGLRTICVGDRTQARPKWLDLSFTDLHSFSRALQ